VPSESTEAAPLIGLVIIGLLTGGGWMWVLSGEPPAQQVNLPEPVLQPAHLASGNTPADDAIEALARSSSQHSIRCAVQPDLPVHWPFEVAHHQDGLLRAIVRTNRGSRLLWPSAEEDAYKPAGLLQWSGAGPGVGGCKLVPTTQADVRGTVSVDGNPATDVRIRVCGETRKADSNGVFEYVAWAGQHCLAYVAEPGITQAFVPFVVPPEGLSGLVLDAQRVGLTGSASLPERRVLIPRSSLSDRALRDPSLSEEARAVLTGWSQESLQRHVDRTEIAREVEGLTTGAEPPTP